MNISLKKSLLLVAGLIIGLAAHSQTLNGTIQIPGSNGGTRQLIKPADSSSITATAGPSIVMPVIPPSVSRADVVTIVNANASVFDKSWTRYFLGQSRSQSGYGLGAYVTINYDGTITIVSPAGSQALGTPQQAMPVHISSVSYTRGCVSGAYEIQGYSITPFFTQEAAFNGGQPYDWGFVPDAPTPTLGCAGGS